MLSSHLSFECLGTINHKDRERMALWGKLIADDPSSVLEIHMVERKNRILLLSSICMAWCVDTHTHIHTQFFKCSA